MTNQIIICNVKKLFFSFFLLCSNIKHKRTTPTSPLFALHQNKKKKFQPKNKSMQKKTYFRPTVNKKSK